MTAVFHDSSHGVDWRHGSNGEDGSHSPIMIESPVLGGIATARDTIAYNVDTIGTLPRPCSTTTSMAAFAPETIVDLAAEYGYGGPQQDDPDELAAWNRRGADRKSLELFEKTLRSRSGTRSSALPRNVLRIWRRTASCTAEVRYAPELSTERKLTLDEVIDTWRGSGSVRSGRPRRGTPS